MRARAQLGIVGFVVVGLGIWVVVRGTPVEGQDRADRVIVANTLSEPVPSHILNDPRSPVPIFLPDGTTALRVCPVTCGTYQKEVRTTVARGTNGFVEFDVPTGLTRSRLTIHQVAVQVYGTTALANPSVAVLSGNLEAL